MGRVAALDRAPLRLSGGTRSCDSCERVPNRCRTGSAKRPISGEVLGVCYFQSAEKFKSRCATFGFSDEASLDEGAMWPTSFALAELTATEEAKISALVKKAVS